MLRESKKKEATRKTSFADCNQNIIPPVHISQPYDVVKASPEELRAQLKSGIIHNNKEYFYVQESYDTCLFFVQHAVITI